MNTWNTALYENRHTFVWEYGESLLENLAPQSGESILDLGCGTGHLTAKIAQSGAQTWGIDASSSMIQQAQQNYPDLWFEVADARNFMVENPLDAVFSNAALHWILQPDAVLECVARSLKPGGRFVAELGGRGNIQAIMQALFDALAAVGEHHPEGLSPWYFPSVSEYAVRLERQGLEVRQAMLFDRPTRLEGGKVGLANWLQMFANGILAKRSPEEQSAIIQSVEMQLQSTLYRDGDWWADYRRLRIVAVKVDSTFD